MKILFYTARPKTNASSKIHAYQYARVFRRLGATVTFNKPFGVCLDMYIKNKDKKVRQHILYKILIKYIVYVLIPIRRFFQLLDIAFQDVIVIQKCMSYWFDYLFFEKATIKIAKFLKKRVVYHFDDIVEGTYITKMIYLIKHCEAVITVNKRLADFARKINPNVCMIPESISENEKRMDIQSAHGTQITIGWIGSSGNDKYESITNMIEAVEKLCAEYDIELLIVSNEPLALGTNSKVKVNNVRWSEKIDEGFYCDVAINPLKPELTEQGKGSYKLLKFMARGIPCVTSWTSDEFVKHNRTCLVARNNQEWYSMLKDLLENKTLRRRIVEGGIKEAEQYRARVVGTKYYKALSTLCSRDS